MTIEAAWFILSGFVLGFAVSTFWEWLYYRKQRLQWRDRRVAELEDQLTQQSPDAPYRAAARLNREATTSPSAPSSDASPAAPVPSETNSPLYRSRAALLRSEQESIDEHA